MSFLIPSKVSCSTKRQSRLTHTPCPSAHLNDSEPQDVRFSKQPRPQAQRTAPDPRPPSPRGGATVLRESGLQCACACARLGPHRGYKCVVCILFRALLRAELLSFGLSSRAAGWPSFLPTPHYQILQRAGHSRPFLLEVSGPVGFPAARPHPLGCLRRASPGNPRLGLRCRERPPSLRRHAGPHSAAQPCFLASVGLGPHAVPSQSTLGISLLSQPLAGCCSNCLFSCLSPLDCKAREGRVRVCRASSGGLSTFQGASHVVGIQGVLVK